MCVGGIRKSVIRTSGKVEVQVDRSGASGIAIHIGARVLQACDPGQVLMTSTVAGLLAGSALDLVEHGRRGLRCVRAARGDPPHRLWQALRCTRSKASPACASKPSATPVAAAIGSRRPRVRPRPAGQGWATPPSNQHGMRRSWLLLAIAAVLGVAALSPAATAGGSPRAELVRTGFGGAGEPNIGIAKDGTLYSTVTSKTVRSTDNGKTWADITPAGHVTTLDPFLYVDKATGRVFKSDLAGTCQLLSYSDDRGATWTSLPAACNLSDHQSISAGPARSSTTVGYPNVVYNCSQTVGYNGYSFASGCDRSLDGGRTFFPSGTFPFADPSPYGAGANSGDSGIPAHCIGDVGAINAGPDGTLYVPRGWCGQPWVAISRDEGLTWTRTQVAKNGMNTTLSGGFGFVAPGSGQSDYQATVMADKVGHVFFFWVALDRLPYIAVSNDGGKTFGAPIRVSPPQVREAWGPALDLDDKGRLALAYMGSTNSPGAPWTAPYGGVTFTGYLGLIAKPLAARPAIVSAAVTPADAPLAFGKCGPGRCNSAILDFIDVALAPDGSVWGAFVDSSSSKRELVMGHLAS